ncbi:hypothetical protein [Streptomyces uncialis]|uniref:hypothetical protein n=1 Tax=Streptomyces uncialis TaxID=1048205 RepID=UPI0038683082
MHGGHAEVAVLGGGVGEGGLVVGDGARVVEVAAVVHAGFPELDGLGPVAEADALHGETAQACLGQFWVAGFGGQVEGVCVVALGEPTQFGGVAFVLGHPAGEVDKLRGRGEQVAAGGLGEAAFQPGATSWMR